MAKKDSVNVIVTIVERSQGIKMLKLYNKHQVEFHYQCNGVGTASSELLDMLGFGTSERDILLSFASAKSARRLLNDLNEDLRGSIHCKGIVFDMPLTGLNQMVVSMLLNPENYQGREEEFIMEQSKKHSLILAVVNLGHTDVVMDTAKKAGATGGTIIRSRWVGSEHIKQFYGVTFQEEREVIAIVATAENRNAIMESINKMHGVNTEAGAVICSVGIEQSILLG